MLHAFRCCGDTLVAVRSAFVGQVVNLLPIGNRHWRCTTQSPPALLPARPSPGNRYEWIHQEMNVVRHNYKRVELIGPGKFPTEAGRPIANRPQVTNLPHLLKSCPTC